MNTPCGCCSGPEILTPLATANRSGLSALTYRAGTWATFLQTMQARLSSQDYPELAGLQTRDSADPSIALLDAWAILGDVLTFYQERIANEGYLRTATERFSVLELARLLGYQLRPGVAASVYLAFTIDQNAAPVTIPAGTGANSVPGPGEQMQTFETSDPLAARAGWNALKPRPTQPQTADTIAKSGLYLSGTSTGLKADDPLLVDRGNGLEFFHIQSVQADPDKKWTVVQLPADASGQAVTATAPAGATAAMPTTPAEAAMPDTGGAARPGTKGQSLGSLVDALKLPPSVPPASPARLSRTTAGSFAAGADAYPRLLAVVEPRLGEDLYTAVGNIVPPEVPIQAFAMRVSAAPFGHNAPLHLDSVTDNVPNFGEWQITNPSGNYDYGGGNGIGVIMLMPSLPAPDLPGYHRPDVVLLDNEYDIAPDSHVVIDNPELPRPVVIDHADQIVHRSLAAYGLAGKIVQVNLPAASPWLSQYGPNDFANVRSTKVYAGSEALTLAEVPVSEDVKGTEVALDSVYPDLEPGRWLIVAGERTDVRDGQGQVVPGIQAAELVMLADVKQAATGLPGDSTYTVITFAEALQYTYKRDTATIYGNVMHATHGQTRQQVLGSGDSTQALQTFTLSQPPLTYVSAPTPSGAASTLLVRVNDVLWHEAAGLAELGPNDRKYITKTNDDATTNVVFGNGQRGARLPTGQNNVRATYRNGIGAPGDVTAGQISLLASKPLGVKGVVNPIRASGGADKEDLDAARRNTPIAAVALDRLVSVLDYADFSRTFTGVGKAVAARLSDGRRLVVHVTIAGEDDIPIDDTSDLFRNLGDALHRYGDPFLPVKLAVREQLVLVMSARVKVQADYEWETVEAATRAALLGEFGFANVDLAEDLLLTDAVATGQAVAGVEAIEVEVFDTISEAELVAGFSTAAAKKLQLKDRIVVRPARPGLKLDLLPAQIAYLPPGVPATLILQEWTL
jgi:predicted phage baseplate assembly protein